MRRRLGAIKRRLQRLFWRPKVVSLSSLQAEGGEFPVRGVSRPEIYTVASGSKRLVPSMQALAALGYQLKDVPYVPDAELLAIPSAADNNSVERNYAVWQTYDWSQSGEEWTVSRDWKQSLIDEVMLKWIKPGGTVLEIGPGGGRWTDTLKELAQQLVLVDLSDKCIEQCKERFAGSSNIEYFVNDGSSLRFLEDGSIDRLWSFDVFVHIGPAETSAYLAEIARVFRPGALGVIHHPGEGGDFGGWRSAITAAQFAELVRESGLTVIEQFDSWAGGRFDVRPHHDRITVFRR